MKKNRIFVSLILLPLLTGCSGSLSPNNQRFFRDETHEEVITMREVIKVGEKQGYPAPSKGNTRVLVVPVEFADYPADDIAKTDTAPGRGAANAKEDIRKVFFGNPEDTMWHSLASYYRESSYGNLNFNGIVTDWFKIYTNPNTMKQVTCQEFKDNNGTAAGLAQNILDYYTDETLQKYTEFKNEDGTNMFKSGVEFLKYFDSNSDGCIDILEMVYSAPYHVKGADGKPIDDDLFWAYCGGTGTEGSLAKPKLSKWAFQSFFTLYEGGTFDNGTWREWTNEEIATGVAKVDGHTIIHETGHGLGLPDYYDYDYKRSPLCGVDMMDHNVGDHNSYSKSLYGWTNPVVVTGPTRVTVKSFTKTGECIMVPYRGYFDSDSKYLNTFFTEYIAIELYNPTGVNALDSAQKYAGAYPLCPSITGVKVYHVDSRLGLFDYSSGSGQLVDYTESIISTTNSQIVTTAHSNTGSRTPKVNNEYQWLIEYLGRDSTNPAKVIANDNLFQQGDKFGYDSYKGFTFHSGKKFGFKFEIESVSDDEMTIAFYKA